MFLLTSYVDSPLLLAGATTLHHTPRSSVAGEKSDEMDSVKELRRTMRDVATSDGSFISCASSRRASMRSDVQSDWERVQGDMSDHASRPFCDALQATAR